MIKESKSGIYKITNLITGKSYVGQAIDINKRWQGHRKLYKNNSESSNRNPLYQDMQRLGIENFLFSIIEECPISELDIKERYWIKYYDTFNNGYNRTEGGQTAPHANKMTIEIFNNIVKDLQTTLDNSEVIGERYGISGRVVRAINSGESWKKDYLSYPIRESLIDINRKNKEKENKSICLDILAKEHVAKIEENRLHGLYLAEKIIKSNFTQVANEYQTSTTTIRRWCKKDEIPTTIEELKEWYYNQIGQEYKKKIKRHKKDIPKRSKSVQQIDVETNMVIKEFSSLIEAARSLNKTKSATKYISKACQNNTISFGYKWKYI